MQPHPSADNWIKALLSKALTTRAKPRFSHHQPSHQEAYTILLASSIISEVAQWCLTLCDPMDCSPPGSSIHGIFQARVLEWVAIAFSRGSSWLRDRTLVSHIADRCFTVWSTREALWQTKSKKHSLTAAKTKTILQKVNHNEKQKAMSQMKGQENPQKNS